jgi:cytoskeleton protein RodZ
MPTSSPWVRARDSPLAATEPRTPIYAGSGQYGGMPPDEQSIGSVLKEERQRQGLDIRAIEDRTKIRTKYLRALENEDWHVLPGPAYVRGFLRAYAETLGLDADALVDEYRSRVEGEESQPFGIAEAVLSKRRPLDARDRPRFDRRILVGGLVAVVAVILLILGLAGGSDDEEGDGKKAGGDRKREKPDGKPEEEQKPEVPDTVELAVAARSDSEVCLVNKGGAVLLDNQLLSAGDEENYEADAFSLSLGFGTLKLDVNGDGERIEAASDAPLTFEITPKGVRQPVADPDPDCP